MRFLSVSISILLLNIASFAQGKRPIVIYLAGDSTMAEKRAEKRPETGWGERLQQYFDTNKVRVENHAQNGRSTKTFISENRWRTIVEKLKKGDYVFIQFGHNDAAKEKGERYTPPADYRANLIKFIGEARAKKAVPVLFTPVMRRRFDREGKFYDTHGAYPGIVRAVAKEYDAPLVDMHRASEKLLIEMGAENSQKLFLILRKGESQNYPDGLDDNTHFSPQGAEEMARLAVEGLRAAKIKLAKNLIKNAATNGNGF